MKNVLKISLGLSLLILTLHLNAQNIKNNPGSNHGNKFEQLATILPDANTYRTASGAPGHQYWQQRADYEIEATLDEANLMVSGKEKITYYNNSPDPLKYLWLQLDENEHHPDAESNHFNGSKIDTPATSGQMKALRIREVLKGLGVQIISVRDGSGKSLPYTINNTMMRVDLPKTLSARKKTVLQIEWKYNIPDRMNAGGRGGYEMFEDGNALFTIAQWFPRMCVYSDFQGWNNKQFTGRGEFSLVFGNYKVQFTVPADHVVAATGECKNLKQVLNKTHWEKWQQSQVSNTPLEIVTLSEAIKKEQSPVLQATKTWKFEAKNVRDFALGSSRKFVWDAMKINIDGKDIMCMSFYPKESYALYSRYSTKAVAHTLRVYSRFTVPYPYPVAISVEAANGMEYPMIAFNYGRTEQDGSYSATTKYGMIGVIIHEVGHNFFPMIINSDERNATWMDEGLNTFVQFLAEQEWDNNYPSSRGPAPKIVDYMKLPAEQLEPIMTNSENIIHFGPNAYAKPAAGLNILRETIMGRELFDYAFKEYAQRWAFKHPTPADFFRTMEDASGIDLDWFWRGWFYDIEPVDISLDSVKAFTLERGNVKISTPDTIRNIPYVVDTFRHISQIRNLAEGKKFLVDTDTTLRDFYYYYKPENEPFIPYSIEYKNDGFENWTNETFAPFEGKYYYELNFSNKGGMVMPIIIQWNYKDGTSETEYIHAYIWRKNEYNVTKTFMKDKEVLSIQIDPYRETADIDESNNIWPGAEFPLNRFELFKEKRTIRGANNSDNPMQKSMQKGK